MDLRSVAHDVPTRSATYNRPEMTSEQDRLLTERIAGHFPGASITPDGIELGFGGLRLKCWVANLNHAGDYTAASLFFNLSGGVLGQPPIFLSASGYERSENNAIILGACNWACSFGPVLRAALAGEEQPDVDRFDVTHDGQAFRVFVDGLDRTMHFGGEAEDPSVRLRATRERFGATPWLTRIVLESRRLPPGPLSFLRTAGRELGASRRRVPTGWERTGETGSATGCPE
jgi:hypothetical protein